MLASVTYISSAGERGIQLQGAISVPRTFGITRPYPYRNTEMPSNMCARAYACMCEGVRVRMHARVRWTLLSWPSASVNAGKISKSLEHCACVHVCGELGYRGPLTQ